MNPLKLFTRPEYFYRPRQILTRLRRAGPSPVPLTDRVVLPWGETLIVHPHEVIGAEIWYHGLFGLLVAEALWRLLEPAELALDIGANIGQFTSLLRHRVGAQGEVISFEPHPELFAELSANITTSPSHARSARVQLHPVALSDQAGEAVLDAGPQWAHNRGLSKLIAADAANAQSLKVRVARLDDVLPRTAKVGVCKIDVEGHELKVFAGAEQLLREQRIRDIVFEDLAPYPSPVHRRLAESGFQLFWLQNSFWGPRLTLLDAQSVRQIPPEGADYLATLAPERARARFAAAGWQVLRG